MARGLGRIDLAGAVITTTIPEDLRQRARAEVQRRQANRTVQAATTAAASPPPAPTPTPVPIPYPLEDLYAMAIDAKLEVTLKFSSLPQAKPAGAGKMAFALKTPEGQFVTAVINNKTWNKLVKANADWPSWVAALSGTMGERTEKGFTLANPGLQVFERKPKVSAEAASPQAEAPTAAPNPATAAPSPSLSPTTPGPRAPASPVAVSPAADTAMPSLASRGSVPDLDITQVLQIRTG